MYCVYRTQFFIYLSVKFQGKGLNFLQNMDEGALKI